MAEPEVILTRLRAALRTTTSALVHPSSDRLDARAALPPGGATPAQQLELLARQLEALRATLLRGPAEEVLPRLAAAEGWKRVAAHHGALTDSALAACGAEVCWTDAGYAVEELERAEAAVTECEALVAQTGSILVTAATCGGRALSVLAPHHVVLARVGQVVPDLTAAYARLVERYGMALPSSLSLITGPSRTGDIERILVLGAHGPARLTVVLSD